VSGGILWFWHEAGRLYRPVIRKWLSGRLAKSWRPGRQKDYGPVAWEGASMIYLDYAGSGWPRPWLGERYAQYVTAYGVNPHGGSCYAEECRRAVLGAERRVLACLGLGEGEARIIWTSGCTEALNLAIHGYLAVHDGGLMVDGGAHPAMLEACQAWSGRDRRLVAVSPLDAAGQMVPGDGVQAQALLAVCHVNNETGAGQDLLRLRDVAGRGPARPRLLVDAAQSLGRRDLPWREAMIDLLALSGRKLGGPAAVGALVYRPDIRLRPMILGGGQQGGLRSGTLDTVGILLFADAVEAACRERVASARRAGELSGRLWAGLASGGFPPWVRLSPVDGDRHIASWSFPGYEGAVVMRLLAERHGILIATGSACSAESGKTSHVLAAMGHDQVTARGALRVSFGWQSALADVDALLQALAAVLAAY
jgi:cysteine desulfurase